MVFISKKYFLIYSEASQSGVSQFATFHRLFLQKPILVILHKPEIEEILYSEEHNFVFFTMLFVSFQAEILRTIYFINFVTLT